MISNLPLFTPDTSRASAPIGKQLQEHLRRAILLGKLGPGEKLPASRILADTLGISRNTVVSTYDQLTAEGYLVAKPGSGTYVAEGQRQAKTRADSPEHAANLLPTLSPWGRRLLEEVPDALLRRSSHRALSCDFLYGEPDYSELPRVTWNRQLSRTARSLSGRSLGYAPHGGLDSLRVSLAGYLSRSRGVRCSPEQVVITQGTQEALYWLTQLFLTPGDTAVMEEPGYRGARKALLSVGARSHLAPVDEHGIVTASLERAFDDTPQHPPKMIFVTPSHQFPCGGVLPLDRRLSLLAWAANHRALVVEDDYDSEFRYSGRPVECLQSLDTNGCVAYLGSASKALFPALRIGWMVLPPKLAELVTRAKSVSDSFPSPLIQQALADFIDSGQLDRHIHRARRRMSERRSALLTSITTHLRSDATVLGSAAGLHVLLSLPGTPRRKTHAIIAASEARGVGVYSAEPYYAYPPEHVQLVLGYAALSPKQIDNGVQILAQSIGTVANS
ncbi:MAG: PLP-dependent aminotransferase family protein [Pseudomonadaceae bacterium]|nr:PLP-dependent aminotransferase family protein [Pseudomonadaceae bacterium]